MNSTGLERYGIEWKLQFSNKQTNAWVNDPPEDKVGDENDEEEQQLRVPTKRVIGVALKRLYKRRMGYIKHRYLLPMALRRGRLLPVRVRYQNI